jgi:tRNA A-37 threonylcarbamoyl transferase component Bud32
MERNTQLLKQDTGGGVGLLPLQAKLCCLKLYRQKSLLQRCQFRLGRGRAVRSFDMGAALREAGLSVAEPLACLLAQQGMLLLTTAIPHAMTLQNLWKSGTSDDQLRDALLEAAAVLARLHCAGYAHGDYKWSNLLWSGGECWLVDLDATAAAPLGGTRQARDLARFVLNAEEMAVAGDTFEAVMQRYLQGTGQTRQQVFSQLLPDLHKLRARHLARYGACGEPLL